MFIDILEVSRGHLAHDPKQHGLVLAINSGSSVAGRLVHCRICQSYNWYANCPIQAEWMEPKTTAIEAKITTTFNANNVPTYPSQSKDNLDKTWSDM
ncbi:hypothetical protein DPMN_188323 [Dreissena polymorpha]|uniref:Uncharacterized protein n=1 Tax=Dreissena polymorpha TaxID=45954 RepID=A0A9D4DQP1_DREPO|nr:hypothetical protein DPMN_188323 [Dreissena polymorpha]